MLEIGSIIDGKYKILNKIGQGGMSVVYLAMNERANKQWAIKEVRKDGVKDYDVVRQGLIAETDILKRLNHPHLPSIIDVIDRDDTFLIVMDYIEGKSLDHWLKKDGAQPQEKVVEWAKQICDVLGYLHSRKPPIIYRDLKPANVMLKPDGQIMIIDFGTAREFKETSIEDTSCLGTQGYAAPEQYGGHGQTDARTDIYTLGATMYHLLTGHNPSLPPYEMYPIRRWNPALSSGLEKIVLKCTQRNPNDRYQNCAELMYALEHYGELDSAYRRKQSIKWKSFVASCALTVVSLAGSIGFKVAESKTIKNSYDGYISEATKVTTQEERADYYEKEYYMMKNIRNAITYPVMMVGMLLIVLFVLFTRVMPVFEQVYAQLGVQMSPLSQAASRLGGILSGAALVVFVLLVVAVLIAAIAAGAGKELTIAHKLMERLKRNSKTALAAAGRRFTAVLALTIRSGMELDKGMELARELVDNGKVAEKIDVCSEKLQLGEGYYEAMKESGLFSSFHIQLIKVGVRSGKMDEVLQEISDDYEQQADASIDAMVARLEPTLVAVLAVAVGLILLSVMLPLAGILAGVG